MTIQEIFNSNNDVNSIIAELKNKTIYVPSWSGRFGLEKEYNPKKHPVMNKAIYPDISNPDGTIESVTRVTYDLQRLAVNRMSELICGIPVKRIYKPENDTQKKIASYMEKIFLKNRIDTVNIERTRYLFAGCEVLTLWYAVEDRNNLYGFTSPLKIRCKNFSPMNGDELYPYFDDYGDMIAMSVAYSKRIANKTTNYFETYTADHHYKWSNSGAGEWITEVDEIITLGKIPAIYLNRPTPIWEHTSGIVYEMEWSMSRNGNYLRKNSKPLFTIFSDDVIDYGNEKSENKEARSIIQLPQGAKAEYVTWTQAIENLKFYITELRQSFFTQLQLPDWSYESMKSTPMSGESRKQLFIDAQLKVKDESGRLLEAFDREVNVVKSFLKIALGERMASEIEALPVESEITAYSINDEADTIKNLTTANGGKPIMSQRESIEEFGHSTDIDKTMQELAEENMIDGFNLTE